MSVGLSIEPLLGGIFGAIAICCVFVAICAYAKCWRVKNKEQSVQMSTPPDGQTATSSASVSVNTQTQPLGAIEAHVAKTTLVSSTSQAGRAELIGDAVVEPSPPTMEAEPSMSFVRFERLHHARGATVSGTADNRPACEASAQKASKTSSPIVVGK